MSFDKPFLNFVRAKASFTEEFTERSKRNKSEKQGTLTGVEAKDFYKSVVSLTSSGDDKNNSNGIDFKTEVHEQDDSEEKNAIASTIARSTLRKRRLHHNSTAILSSNKKTNEKQTKPEERNKEVNCTTEVRLVNKFLRCAQEGQLNEIKKLLSDNCIDIDSTDQFSWTALMCAVHSEQTPIVRYLLENGASWKGIFNSQGKTALDLARAVSNHAIIKILEAETHTGVSKRHNLKSHSVVPKVFWCTVCNQEFTEDEKRHQSSTVHQFNCQHKPKGPYFSIAEDNPGYKLMVKSGWDGEKGLGPEGEGRKFPIKTILKRDRYGLGNKTSSKARVTHFGPNDQDAVKIKKTEKNVGRKESNRTLSKKQKRLKESKEKMWEHNMRIYMNS